MRWLGRFKSGSRGVPSPALVVVDRSVGPEPSRSSMRTLLDARLRPLPEGSGPEGDVRQLVPSHQAYLVTAGMEIPALLDEVSGQPIGVQVEGMDEAIGRHYLRAEPEHGTWEAALVTKRAEVRRTTGVLGDIRYGLDQVRDAGAAARALPGGLRSAAKDWKSAVGELGATHPAGSPVEGVDFDAWVAIKLALARGEAGEAGESAFAEARGVTPGRWEAVNAHWEREVQWNASARALYERAVEADAGA